MTQTSAPTGGEQAFFQVSTLWHETYRGAHAGILVMRGATNPAAHAGLQKRKTELEDELRARHAGQDRAALLEDPILKAYDEHYRRFKKTYHIQLQLESIVFKGKAIPTVSALVEAMFMAEMQTLLLTAGHDLDVVKLPLTLEVAQGTESYTLLRGEAQTPKAGDMMICDTEGIVSSIVYGPDQRTQIAAQTRNAIFTAYAPAGISIQAIEDHLGVLQRNVELIAPAATVELRRIYGQ
jgi:DNA/RNA-binding domain of Phe-tRNA-synthetase-like protein